MIWLISQLLVQPSISPFQFYHVIFNPGMDLCLVVQARIWENSWGNLQKIFNWVMKIIHEIILFMHWQPMGPMNYNNAYCWVHLMCKELFMLWTIVSQTFQYSMRPNFLALVIIQAMIVTESQIPNCGSKGYCWSFNTLKKRRTCVRENSWDLRKHCNCYMSVRTKWYLRLDAYMVAISNGTQIGLNLCNFGRKVHSFHQV